MASNTQQRYTVKQLNICATYTLAHEGETDTCTICKNMLTCPSPDNLEKNTYAIRVTHGKCSHMFHDTCIKKFITNNAEVCPTCTIPWVENGVHKIEYAYDCK